MILLRNLNRPFPSKTVRSNSSSKSSSYLTPYHRSIRLPVRPYTSLNHHLPAVSSTTTPSSILSTAFSTLTSVTPGSTTPIPIAPMDRQLLIAKELTATLPYLQGIDSDGKTYKDIYTLWKYKLDEKYTAYQKLTAVPTSGTKPRKSSSTSTLSTPSLDDINEQRIALWYNAGRQYWATTTTDVDGVLGGQAHVHAMDIRASQRFLTRIMKKYGISSHRCLDCGAGIGRITRDLLINVFDVCDLLEQDVSMLKVAIENISKDTVEYQKQQHLRTGKTTTKKGQLGLVHVAGLQEYSVISTPTVPSTNVTIPLAPTLTPHQTTSLLPSSSSVVVTAGETTLTTQTRPNRRSSSPSSASSSLSSPSSVDLALINYDVIWIQWVVGCIIDSDFVKFLACLSTQLSPHGYVIIKDNCCRTGLGFWYDNEDDSIQRSKEYLECLYNLAGFTILERTVTGNDDLTNTNGSKSLSSSSSSSTTTIGTDTDTGKRPRRDSSSNSNTKETKTKKETKDDDDNDQDEWDPELMSVRTWLLCPTHRVPGTTTSSTARK